ncbi:MAG: ATP-binding protein, partial [Dysgonamonadaceae bacterium]|nr:ATP-binding protein [Dysgonamonadaceae bacterium]
GQVVREPAVGNGRLDLCIVYQGFKYPVELKIRYDSKTLHKGLEQTALYMDKYDCKEGWLVIFDRRKSVSWSKKIYQKKYIVDGKTVTVAGA